MTDFIFNFTLTELFAFLGLIQSVYILVYILFRSRRVSFTIIPLCYFTLLGSGFFIITAQKFWLIPIDLYNAINWYIWSLCAPLSFLLVAQIARISQPPPLVFMPIVFIVPFAYLLSKWVHNTYQLDFQDILSVSAIILGALCLLLIWAKRGEVDRLHKRQNGEERFWLIISIILLNIGLLSLNLLFMEASKIDLVRIFIGLGFIYVSSTSLLRVYPPAIYDTENKNKVTDRKNQLSSDDINIALQIENLLHLDKVYQEPNYNRAVMARELNLPEAQLSKIVNTYFDKNVPLLLNELRVEEAKALLKQTKEDISLIAEEAGFNSIATFNRVFKDLEGVSPKQYRQAD